MNNVLYSISFFSLVLCSYAMFAMEKYTGPSAEEYFEAVKAKNVGDINTWKKSPFINKKYVLNTTPPVEVTPLMYAVDNNDLGMVALLLKNGAKVAGDDGTNNVGVNALMVAVIKGNEDIFHTLMQAINKTDLNAINKQGATVLALAAAHGKLKFVEMILGEKSFINVNARFKHGRTDLKYPEFSALEAAIVHDYKRIADVHNYKRIAEMLLARPDIDLSRVLEFLPYSHDNEVISLIINDPRINFNKPVPALIEAARLMNPELIDALLAHPKIDINAQDPEGNTALMILSSNPEIPLKFVQKILNADYYVPYKGRVIFGFDNTYLDYVNHPKKYEHIPNEAFVDYSAWFKRDSALPKRLIDFTLKNNAGKTAAQLAEETDRSDIFGVLQSSATKYPRTLKRTDWFGK